MKTPEITETLNYQHSKIILDSPFTDFRKFIPKDKLNRTIIITDTNINRIYGKSFSELPIIEIPAGEDSKSMDQILSIMEKLLNMGADRHSFLLAIGGGVVCDISGFVASIFMRGIDFGYISTSLLSQVDASIGGKTGINYLNYKNIIGAFNHPSFVICDQSMISTLPKSEFINGLGEVVKHAVISDKEMFNFMQENHRKIIKQDDESINYLIEKSIQIKSNIVNQDERENGLRKKLNFGHTIGHAIEVNSDYNHGEAISIGMVLAAKLSHKKGYCSESIVKMIESLLTNIGLPISTDISSDKLMEAILKDKKKKGMEIDFVFVEDIGKLKIEKVSAMEIINALEK